MSSKTFVVIGAITAAALCAGCERAQLAENTAEPAVATPVMTAPPSEKPAAVKAVQVRKPAAPVAAKTSEADVTPANIPAGDTAGKQETPTLATISGCLEREGDIFRLKNTSGEDAPKSRSWKSGFIKKSSASIDIVEGALRLKLADHVGRRVTMTGLLTERQIQARSVRVTAEGCD